MSVLPVSPAVPPALPPHGGRVQAAMQRYPQAPHPFIDLSTGINPHPYPLPVLPDAAFHRLPEPEDEAALCAAAALAFGMPDAWHAESRAMQVALAPGSQSLIALLPRLFPMRHVAILGPTYAEHAAAWQAAGAATTIVAGLDDVGDADGVVLCNPNNPDGRRRRPTDLLPLAAQLAARGGLLVVDEAYADLEPGPVSLAPHLPQPGIVVLRSFGKTYGHAGLRLGFALGDAGRVQKIRTALGPWPVSGPAMAVARAALPDAAWRNAMADHLSTAAQRLDALLMRAGLHILGGTCLFRLARHPTAQAIATRLGLHGIVVRCFAEHPQWLRFGLPGCDAAWRRLTAALPAAGA